MTIAPAPAPTTLGRSTPSLYRIGSIITAVALAFAALGGFLAASALDSRTGQLRNRTGPVLVATQELFSSLAEANSAATSAYLSGANEDREARRNYELAVERSAFLVERVASLIGDSALAHQALADLAGKLTRYAGLVETARTQLRAGSASSAGASLSSALDLMNSGIAGDISRLNAATSARLDSDYRRPVLQLLTSVVLLAVAVGCLLWLQRAITKRTKRLLNLPLAASTVVLVIALVWLVVAENRQRSDLDAGRDRGYESIALTSQIQTTAYRAKAAEAVVLTSDARGTAAFEAVETASKALAGAALDARVVVDARDGKPLSGSGLLIDAAARANGARERAAASEMLVRWQRYRDVSTALQAAAAGGDQRGATALALQSGSSAFTGFNLSVESVLRDNREEFAAELTAASDRLRLLRVGMLALPLIALLLMLWGVQMRISEYR